MKLFARLRQLLEGLQLDETRYKPTREDRWALWDLQRRVYFLAEKAYEYENP